MSRSNSRLAFTGSAASRDRAYKLESSTKRLDSKGSRNGSFSATSDGRVESRAESRVADESGPVSRKKLESSKRSLSSSSVRHDSDRRKEGESRSSGGEKRNSRELRRTVERKASSRRTRTEPLESSGSTAAANGDGHGHVDFFSIKQRIEAKKKQERKVMSKERRAARRAAGEQEDEDLSFESVSDDDEFDDGHEELSKHFKREKMLLVGRIGSLQVKVKNAKGNEKAFIEVELTKLRKELADLDKNISAVEQKRHVSYVPVQVSNPNSQASSPSGSRAGSLRLSTSSAKSTGDERAKQLKLRKMVLVGKVGTTRVALKNAATNDERDRLAAELEALEVELGALDQDINREQSDAVQSSLVPLEAMSNMSVQDAQARKLLDREASRSMQGSRILRVYKHGDTGALESRSYWTLAVNEEQTSAELCDKLCDKMQKPFGSLELHQQKPDGTEDECIDDNELPFHVVASWPSEYSFILAVSSRSAASSTDGSVRRDSSSTPLSPKRLSAGRRSSPLTSQRNSRGSWMATKSGSSRNLVESGSNSPGSSERRLSSTAGATPSLPPPPLLPAAGTRERVVAELCMAEESYIEDLQTIMRVYQTPLGETNTLDKEVRATIFRNASKLLPTHQVLISRLRANPNAICATLCSLKETAEVYYVYCAGQSAARNVLATATRDNREFLAFCSKQLALPGDYHLCLRRLLRRPLEHLLFYRHIVLELRDCTSRRHPDYDNIAIAEKITGKLARFVNDIELNDAPRVNVLLASMELDGIPSTLDLSGLEASTGPPASQNAIDLWSRVMIAEAQMVCVYEGATRRWGFYLFSDLLVFASPMNREGRCSFRGWIPFDSVLVVQEGVSDDPRCILVKHPVYCEKPLVIQCRSELERDFWVQHMLKAKDRKRRPGSSRKKMSESKLNEKHREYERRKLVAASAFNEVKKVESFSMVDLFEKYLELSRASRKEAELLMQIVR